MKIKKAKVLFSVLAFAPLCLLAACGNNSSEPTTTPVITTTGSTTSPSQDVDVLSFLNKGQIRIELYDLDVNVSYGNQALASSVNTVAISDNSYITFNKATTENDAYCVIFVGETVGQENFHFKAYKGVEGSSLLEFQELVKDELKGYERAFVTITKGKVVKWTKGLSAKLDAKMESANSTTED